MKHKKLILLTALLLSFTFTLNAQFVSPKKKQQTARYGQWSPANANASLNPKTVVIHKKFSVFNDWQDSLGRKIEKKDNNALKSTYKALFKKASTGTPGTVTVHDAKDRALNNRAYGYYAKLCAFVYYADMDTITTGNTWHKLSENNKRNHFKDRAINFMKMIDYDGHINGFEKLQYSSKGLLMALQAYDLLKAAGGVPQSDLDDMKYSLQWWAKDVYRKANNIGGVWAHKNNHSLITGAALGMAAIVLNDCGWKTKHKDYWKPDHWANKANYEIYNTLFTLTNQTGLHTLPNNFFYYFYSTNTILT